MSLCEQVRAECAAIARHARHVSIDMEALEAISPGDPPPPAPDAHYLDGDPEDVALYFLTLDSINFGSGWFPLLRKRQVDGRALSGYFTVAWALRDRFRSKGPWSALELTRIGAREIAEVLGQSPDLELMSLYAQSLRTLGAFLGDRSTLELIASADGSAERFATMLATGMAPFADRSFYKRAQIAASDLALAGVARFGDMDRLTIFADNLVPHVLRCDGALRYSEDLAEHVDAGRLLPMGHAEREIRGCAVHACELIARRSGVEPRHLDAWLWSRGQSPEYKSRPRHRCRTVYY